VEVTLRALTEPDLDAVEVIEQASYPTPWSRSMLAGEISKPSSVALGAFTPEQGLVGYLIASRYVDAWHVMNVAIDPAFRRRGIAKALMERLFAVTGSDQRRGYTLEVRVSNTEATRLYERLGFRAHGIRRAYYTDNREDALIMWRDGSPADGPATET
jgi:[ribosomal protein S18]-alanine N-acetyltransferase